MNSIPEIPPCETCGNRIDADGLILHCPADEDVPDIFVGFCSHCRAVSEHGTELQKAVFLLATLERQDRLWIAGMMESDFVKKLSRGKRRKIEKDLLADIPSRLQSAIDELPMLAVLREAAP